MTRREIISIGPTYVSESGGWLVAPTQRAYMLMQEIRKAYEEGYEQGRRNRKDRFIWGICFATAIWVLLILFARAL